MIYKALARRHLIHINEEQVMLNGSCPTPEQPLFFADREHLKSDETEDMPFLYRYGKLTNADIWWDSVPPPGQFQFLLRWRVEVMLMLTSAAAAIAMEVTFLSPPLLLRYN